MPVTTKAVLIAGPTASGKSALALALAERLDGTIVNADSMQVYGDLRVITARPAPEEEVRVPHLLYGHVDAGEIYSTGRWLGDAAAAIAGITAAGRLPIVVGGTMMYFKALREGLSALPHGDVQVRAALDSRAARDGWPALHAELARIDPPTAARLSIHDAQRIQRALEVHALTGRPLSALQGARDLADDVGPTIVIAVAPASRAALHAVIAQRFDGMLDAGLVDEVRQLRNRYVLHAQMPSMRCVGYRQVFEYLDGQGDRRALRERGIAATRQLAKRQLTWLRGGDVEPIDCFARDVVATVLQDVERRLDAAGSA